MANHVSHASLPYPIKNARYTLFIPYLDADGDPTDPTTPDTETSLDAGSFADCAEEATTITGSNGSAYITLSGAETNGSLVLVAAKVASGPKATLLEVRPRVLPILESGTAQAGASGTITLTSGAAAYDLAGCIVRTTGGTGGGGTGGANNQARVITAYNTSTKVATIVPNWETTPSSDTTYDVLMTDIATNTIVTRALRPTNDGRTLDVSTGGEAGLDWANVGSPTTTVGLSGTTVKAVTDNVGVGTIANNAITAASINADAITAAKIADGAIDAATFASGAINAAAIASDAITAAKIADGAIDAATFAAGAINAAAIAADAITDAKVASDVTIASVTGSVGSVTGAVGSVTGNVGGNVTGSVGSVTGNVGGNVTGSVGSLAAQAKADVNAEVVDTLNVDTYAEPGQETPPATTTLAKKIGYNYKGMRNRHTQTSSAFKLYGDDATTVDQKATVSDDLTTFERTELEAGP